MKPTDISSPVGKRKGVIQGQVDFVEVLVRGPIARAKLPQRFAENPDSPNV